MGWLSMRDRDRVWAIGVDLGGQSVKLALVDETGRIGPRRQAPLDAGQAVEHITALIVQEINTLSEDARRAGLEPVGVGMVMPGYMDAARSKLVFAANLPTLNGTDFLGTIRRSLDLPVVFDADSNAAAYGEYRFGAGQDVDRLIVVAIGTGIGAGVILGGRILRIWNHIAGSLGHVIVDANGPACRCGGRGCVEAHASGPVFERRAAELADAEPSSRLAALRAASGRLTGVELGQALREGDTAAAKVVQDCGWWLGAGVASWSVIYHPDKVLIGGGIGALGAPLLAAIREGLAEVGQPKATQHVAIGAAALGADAGVVGAAALAMAETETNSAMSAT